MIEAGDFFRRAGNAQGAKKNMDLRFTDEELKFRDEVRAFIRDNLPDSVRDKLVAAWQDVSRMSI